MEGQAKATRACNSFAYAGRSNVLPCPSRHALLARPDGVPRCRSELMVVGSLDFKGLPAARNY
jgi:hypothetical protein